MRRLWRENSLSIVVLSFFLIFLLGQTLTGFQENNDELREHGDAPLTLTAYLGSGHYLEAVFENWESEFLQMGFYVLLTVFLRQKGSAESKRVSGKEEVDEDPRKHRKDPKAPGPVRRGGFLLKVYEHSLTLAFLVLFLLSFLGHAVAGLSLDNQERVHHGEAPRTLGQFMGGSKFWFESFQNWQSEFLAVAAIVILSIYLRQRGSPESKPVAAPHHETGTG